MLLCWIATALAAPVTLAVIGDYGTNEPGADTVAALVASWKPDLIATTGDNNYPDGGADTIDANIGKRYHAFIGNYTGRFGAGALENEFFPALGNHDWRAAGAAPYLEYFTLPGNERYYEVHHGLVDLFIIDSDPHEPDGVTQYSTQAMWLRDRLRESKAPYRFVFMHHPPYSSGPHGSTKDLQWPYAAWGATVVLAGHDHTYERIVKDGITFLVNGLGGEERYPITRQPVEGSIVHYAKKNGALKIAIDETAATFTLVSDDGMTIDQFTVPPSAR
jgi:tartrate-resistant acid phosphatase type 5